MAVLTFFLYVQFDFFLTAKNRFFKGDSDAGAQIGALHGTAASASPTPASSKKVSENISENITKIRTAEIKAAKSSGASVKCGMTVLIILTSFFRIT